jgi:hypothetical protein
MIFRKTGFHFSGSCSGAAKFRDYDALRRPHIQGMKSAEPAAGSGILNL